MTLAAVPAVGGILGASICSERTAPYLAGVILDQIPGMGEGAFAPLGILDDSGRADQATRYGWSGN